jgi:hypothetical protein
MGANGSASAQVGNNANAPDASVNMSANAQGNIPGSNGAPINVSGTGDSTAEANISSEMGTPTVSTSADANAKSGPSSGNSSVIQGQAHGESYGKVTITQ